MFIEGSPLLRVLLRTARVVGILLYRRGVYEMQKLKIQKKWHPG